MDDAQLTERLVVRLLPADIARIDEYAAGLRMKRATVARNLIRDALAALDAVGTQQPARAGGKDSK